MLFSKSREEMLQLAKELGVNVKFDSKNPGVTDLESGKTEDLWTIFEKTGFNMSYIFEEEETERVNPRMNSETTKRFQTFGQECWNCAS